MYNRYIPQPDGSFQRRHHPDRKPEPPTKSPPPPKKPEQPQPQEKPAIRKQTPKEENPLGFLRQLLPKDFDSGDLIVILLLLLIAGDKEEDRAHALLTIALYLVM